MKDEKQQILAAFGSHLKQLRKKSGMTLLELEIQTGISEGNLSKIENGKKNPALTTLVSLAHGLGIPPSDLLHAFSQ